MLYGTVHCHGAQSTYLTANLAFFDKCFAMEI